MSRRLIALAALMALLIIVGWYFLLWSPRRAALSDARDRKDEAVQKRDELQIQLNGLKKAAKTHQQDLKTLARLDELVPAEPDLEGYLRQIRTAATETGVQVNTLTPAPPAAADPTAPGPKVPAGVNVISLGLSANGSYPQLVAFLDRLYNLDRLIVVDTLNLTLQPSTGTLDMSINGRVFTTAPLPVTEETSETTTTTAAP